MSADYERFRSELTEKMAKMFEEDGHSPLVGRIYSLLLSSAEPVSLPEIAARLGVTKAAVSIQARTLERIGLCVKLARGKDRKDYYGIPDDFMQIAMRTVMERLRSELAWIEHTLRRLPGPDAVEPEEQASLVAVKYRFTELLVLYRALFRRLDGLEEEMELWKATGRKEETDVDRG